MLKKILFFLCFLFSSGYALIVQDIDTTKPIKAVFSKTNGNRIAVNGGHVKKILGPPNICSICLEKESGQAFIKLLKPIDKPVIFTVITGSGQVQDIEVTFDDIIMEVIILQEEPLDKRMDGEEREGEDSNDEAVKVVKSMLSNHIPIGYVSRDIEKKSRECYVTDVIFIPQYVIENHENRIFNYLVSNNSQRKVVLSEKLLKNSRDLWIYLEKNCLDRQEKIQAIICERK